MNENYRIAIVKNLISDAIAKQPLLYGWMKKARIDYAGEVERDSKGSVKTYSAVLCSEKGFTSILVESVNDIILPVPETSIYQHNNYDAAYLACKFYEQAVDMVRVYDQYVAACAAIKQAQEPDLIKAMQQVVTEIKQEQPKAEYKTFKQNLEDRIERSKQGRRVLIQEKAVEEMF